MYVIQCIPFQKLFKVKMSNFKLLKELAQSSSVLIVEDQKELNNEFFEFFSLFFKNVQSAFNGEEGLAKLLEQDFDIVISDITMPVKNGIDMIKEFKNINSIKSPNFIIISGHTSEYKDKIEKLELKYYFEKPHNTEILCDTLIKILS